MKTIRTTGLLVALGIAVIAVRWSAGRREDPEDVPASAAAEPAQADAPAGAVEEAIEISTPAAAADSASTDGLARSERASPSVQRAAAGDSGTIRVEPDLGAFAPWITYDELASTRLEAESGAVFRPVECDGPAYTCCFRDVPAGLHRVVVEAPIFRAFRSEPVGPDGLVRPLLRGSATVVVKVTDFDGAPVEAYALSVQGDGAIQSTPSPLRKEADPKPEGGAYAVPPGSWRFTLRVPDRGTQSSEVLDLVAGERREVEIRLERTSRISGVVVDSTGAALPLENVDIVKIDSSRFDATQQFAGKRSPFASQLTTETGEFAFDDLPESTYLVKAYVAPGLEAEQEVEIRPGIRAEGLELRLPPCAYLDGLVLGPSGVPLDVASLLLISPRDPAAAPGLPDLERIRAQSRGQDPYLARCSATGAFRFGPVAPGPYQVCLAFPANAEPEERGGAAFQLNPSSQLLEDVVLPVGPNHLDLDLTSRWPGALEVVVRTDGAATRRATVEARLEGTDRPIVALTGADGIARFEAVPSGSLSLTVIARGGEWRHRSPEPVLVEPAGRAEAIVEVALHEGTLQVLRIDRAPAANAEISVGVRVADNMTLTTRRRADADGRLTLRLPPGRYFLEPGNWNGPPREVEIEWTERGPASAEIVLDVE